MVGWGDDCTTTGGTPCHGALRLNIIRMVNFTLYLTNHNLKGLDGGGAEGKVLPLAG